MANLHTIFIKTLKTEKKIIKDQNDDYSELIVNAGCAMITLNQKGDILLSNKQSELFTGYTHKELTSMNILNLIDQKDHFLFKNHLRKNDTKSHSIIKTIKIIRKNKNNRNAELKLINSKWQEKRVIMMLINQVDKNDITQELTDANQMLHLVIDNIPQIIFWKNADSVYMGCNENFAKAAGVSSPQEVIGKTDYDMTWTTEESKLFRMIDKSVMESDKSHFHILHKQSDAIKGQAYWDLNKIPLRDHNNKVIGVLGTCEDITERRQSQQALEESEAKFRTLSEEIADGIAILINDKHLWVNKAYCEICGYNKKDLINKSIKHIIAPEKWPEIKKRISDRLAGKNVISRYETIGIKKDKKRIILEVVAKLSFFENKKAIQIIVRDITKKKQIEKAIELKLNFQNTITKIASRFVGITDFDKAINDSLKDMGLLSNASRTYLFLFDKKYNFASNTHEWCKKGVKSVMMTMSKLPINEISWWMKKITQEEYIFIEDIKKMPKEAKFEQKLFLNQKIKSLLCFPIYVSNRLEGFIGFDNIEDPGRWSDDDFALLKICSAIFGNTLERKKSQEEKQKTMLKLQKAKEEWKKTVNALTHIVCLVDKEGRIIRANNTIETWNIAEVSQAKRKTIPELFCPKCNEKICKLEENWHKSWQKVLQGESVEWRSENKFAGKLLYIQIKTISENLKQSQDDNFAIVVIYDVTETTQSQKKIFELYKYLGIINRRVSILLDLNRNDFSNQEKSLQLIAKSGRSLSQADFCLLYNYNKIEDRFNLLALNSLIKTDFDHRINQLNPKTIPFLQKIINSKKRYQGKYSELDYNILNINNKIKSFIIFPIIDGNNLSGMLYLGFNNKDTVTTQELELYNLFVIYASFVLRNL